MKVIFPFIDVGYHGHEDNTKDTLINFRIEPDNVLNKPGIRLVFSPGAKRGMISKISTGIHEAIVLYLSSLNSDISDLDRAYKFVIMRYQYGSDTASVINLVKTLLERIFNETTMIKGDLKIKIISPEAFDKVSKFEIGDHVCTIPDSSSTTYREGKVWEKSYHFKEQRFFYKIFTVEGRYHKRYLENILDFHPKSETK